MPTYVIVLGLPLLVSNTPVSNVGAIEEVTAKDTVAGDADNVEVI